MTNPTSVHQHIREDEDVDRHVDDRKDTEPSTDGETLTAFVVVLANHKGGVTKTTSTANLGACLAEAGRDVLIVDCDPQANLSEAFGWTEDLPGERLEDLLANPDAAHAFTPPPALQPDVALELKWRHRLRIIPCTDTLADVAADLPARAGTDTRHGCATSSSPSDTSSTSSYSIPRRGWATCREWPSWPPTDC